MCCMVILKVPPRLPLSHLTSVKQERRSWLLSSSPATVLFSSQPHSAADRGSHS